MRTTETGGGASTSGQMLVKSADSSRVEKNQAAAKVKEVDIRELEARYGWKEGDWQDRLLKAADAADSGRAGRNGRISAQELDKYLANPKDLQFLTSTAMQQERAQVAGGQPKAVDAFQAPWQRDLASRADKLGNQDGKLTDTELDGYLAQIKVNSGGKDFPTWFPDQKQAAYDSKIADFTGEVDHLKPAGGKLNGTQMVKEYMRIATDDTNRIPPFVSYVLTGADIKETPATVNREGDPNSPIPEYRRKNPFHVDEQAGANAVRPADYEKSGFDQGHMKPADDSPTQEAMYESFLMSNMSTQYGALNRQSWRYLEAATHELTEATDGKATVITGNLFLDGKGQPLPPDKISFYEKNGKKIAVPTHCFKTVLLEKPDGTKAMYAYLVPNQPTMPSKKEDIGKLLETSRVSVDQIEKSIGHDLYSQLPKSTQAKLESDPAARMSFVDNGKFSYASLLWPQAPGQVG